MKNGLKNGINYAKKLKNKNILNNIKAEILEISAFN